MNWDAIGAVGEVFGAIAVVVSVVYLAVQVRKQTEEARLSATRDLAVQFQNGIDAISTDGEFAEIWAKGVQDYEALENIDRLRLAIFFQRMTRVLELQFLHTLNKNVDRAYFESINLGFFEFLTFPGVQRWWELSKGMFRMEFRQHIDELVLQAKQKGYESTFKSDTESAN